MANSYLQVYIHYIFSTKNRKPLIKPEFEKKLFAYIGGIGRKMKTPVLVCGGMPDHIHLVVSLSGTKSVSKTIQEIKSNSSKWINENHVTQQKFAWQRGYGAFSLGQSGLKNATRYIQNQKEHHKHKTFKEEYIEFLERYKIEYDEQYVWG
jgi:REP element-mobilizing transposase RayT